MIITDDDPASPTKAQQAAALPAEPVSNPPPAYSGPSSYQSQPAAPAALPDEPLLAWHPEYEHPEPAGRRFMRAFGVALLIYVVTVIFTQGTIAIARHDARRRGSVVINPAIPGQIDHNVNGWPLEADGKIIRCVQDPRQWSEGYLPGMRTTSFELPLTADVLYLFSRGRLSKGVVNINQDEDWMKEDTVRIDVTIVFAPDDYVNRINVCQLERREGHMGVGILTPEAWPLIPNSKTSFVVNVHLPMLHHMTPLRIAAFETAMPNFSQLVGDLHGEVVFGSLSLGSTNGMISAESVYAERGEIKSTNGAIEGSFYTHNNIALLTTNGHIKTTVNLYHDGTSSASTSVQMKTTNGALESSVLLIATGTEEPAPAHPRNASAFDVYAHTSNAPLTLDFPEAPPGARLQADARTSNARAQVSAHRAYEGTFFLRTSNARVEVPFDADAEDPAGRSRTRQLALRRSDRVATGSVSWDGEPEGKGQIQVQTTNGPLTLNLE